jgi:hypothetical protein
MIVVLELLARGEVKGGQNQGNVGDVTVAGVRSAPRLGWPSINPRHLHTPLSTQ